MNNNKRTEKFNKVANLLTHLEPMKYKFQNSNQKRGDLYRQFTIPKMKGTSDVKIHFEINHRKEFGKIQVGFHYEPPAHRLPETQDELVRLLRWRLLGFIQDNPELEYSTVWYNKKKIRASQKGIVHPYEGLSIHKEVDEDIRWQDLFAVSSKFLEDYYENFVEVLN